MSDKRRYPIGGQFDVLRLGLGTNRITGPGRWGEPPDRPEALRVLRRAVELGVDLLDTADAYGPFVSGSSARSGSTTCRASTRW